MNQVLNPQHTPTVVVFAYHNVGVRSIKTLLARGVRIALVVTHTDSADETIWFDSVAGLCQEHGIEYITPETPGDAACLERIRAIAPEFIFSFYYRHMISSELLALASGGAYNLHGSLLPKYRGRVPVNWAVLHGETETGVTLHRMETKPDAGEIIGQSMVPILPDDTAYEIFGKLTVAAEQVLWNTLPALFNGTVPSLPNDLSKGSYFSGRKPEDGRIDWSQTAQQVYNLHRAVAPPYPGAFTEIAGKTYVISKARLISASYKFQNSKIITANLPVGLSVVDNTVFGVCGDQGALHILELLSDGKVVSAQELAQTIINSSNI